MTFRPRVLIVAEAANPDFVSVPLVGWSHSIAIRDVCDAMIVTQIRNKAAFERMGFIEGVDFVAIDSEFVAKPLYKINKVLRRIGLGWTVTTAIAAISYYTFERLLCRTIGSDLRAGRFDLVHRITPLSPTIPSLHLARLCKSSRTPFVIGPLNGGVAWPKEFRSERSAEGEWLSLVRSAHRLLPGYRSTIRTAAAIIVGSKDTQAQLPRSAQSKTVYIAENAIDPTRFSHRSISYNGGPLRIAFVGRLVPYKGAVMMLRAVLPFLVDGRVEVHIYGDGPQRVELENLCEKHGVSDRVKFYGWVPHSNLQGMLSIDHLFVFPSIREFGGAVVLEAMALGVVPLVVDYAGPGELVTLETGLKVPLGSQADIIQGVRKAVGQILESPSRLESLRTRGIERVEEHFTWNAKAAKVLEVYRWVLGARKTKPDIDVGFSSLGMDEQAAQICVAGRDKC